MFDEKYYCTLKILTTILYTVANVTYFIPNCFQKFYLKVMDDWLTQIKSVECILHLPSIDMQVVEIYDKIVLFLQKRT